MLRALFSDKLSSLPPACVKKVPAYVACVVGVNGEGEGERERGRTMGDPFPIYAWYTGYAYVAAFSVRTKRSLRNKTM